MKGTFYNVTSTDGRTNLLVLNTETDKSGKIWSYDKTDKGFWLNAALGEEFYYGSNDSDALGFEAIDESEARQLARRIKPLPAVTRNRFKELQLPFVPETEVFSETMPSRTTVIQRRSQGISSAKPGSWITWKTYPAIKAQAARISASEIRNGKVKSLAGIVDDARLESSNDGEFLVQVRRSAS